MLSITHPKKTMGRSKRRRISVRGSPRDSGVLVPVNDQTHHRTKADRDEGVEGCVRQEPE